MLKAHTQNYQVSIIAIWVVFFIPSLHNLLVIGPPLLKSSETLAEMAKISYFRTLEISQRLPTIWGVFIQEKLLSLIEQGLWHCSLNCSHLSLLRSAVTLKSSRLATTGWAGLVWGTSKKKSPFPKHCPYLTCCPAPWKSPVSLLSLDLSGAQNLIFRKTLASGPLSKTDQWQLILSCWGVSSSCGNKNLTKNLKGRYENKISIKGFEKLLV